MECVKDGMEGANMKELKRCSTCGTKNCARRAKVEDPTAVTCSKWSVVVAAKPAAKKASVPAAPKVVVEPSIRVDEDSRKKKEWWTK